MTLLRSVTDAVLAALIAPPCVSCGHVLDRPLAGAVCTQCWEVIGRATTPVVRLSSSVSSAAAVGEYEGSLRAIIHALKYDGRRSVAPPLTRLMADRGRDILRGADAVVPVPLHRRRERERGFNQAADLARGLGLPVWLMLQRVAPTRAQVALPAEERHHNMRDAFAIRRRRWGGRVRPPDLHGKVIVLVDDVMTTGATLDACARVVRGAGARDVRALTAARVGTGRG